MHFKTVLAGLTPNHNETLVADYPLSGNHNEILVAEWALAPNHNETLVADYGLTPNHNETIVRERPRGRKHRLAAGLGASLLALALLSGGFASAAQPFPPGPSKTASALIRTITVNIQPCL